ncbi:hypothetical protein [Streptomyces sp. NPDC018031]|uniref:hypothetical protein n=1 Tax=Streptomyces sp. NPDC018031 TaxID=3365033 RepID=UPI0037A16B95
MKSLHGFLCFMLVAGGASGLLHERFGWIRLFGFLRYLSPDGYEVYTYLVLIVLGVAVAGAGRAIRR